MDKSPHTAKYRRLLGALRQARECAGLTQGEVAARLRTYASFVSKVESGVCRLDVVELTSLCRAYRTDLVELLRHVGLIA